MQTVGRDGTWVGQRRWRPHRWRGEAMGGSAEGRVPDPHAHQSLDKIVNFRLPITKKHFTYFAEEIWVGLVL